MCVTAVTVRYQAGLSLCSKRPFVCDPPSPQQRPSSPPRTRGMHWSRPDSRSLRYTATAHPSTSQKASSSAGSVATRIDNPNPSLAPFPVPVANSSRFPLSPMNPHLTPSSSSQSKAFDYNASPSPSACGYTQPCSTEMNSVQIGRRITNNFGDDPAPMPARRRSISNRCVCHISLLRLTLLIYYQTRCHFERPDYLAKATDGSVASPRCRA